MNLTFAAVRGNFYPATSVKRETLFREIGWSDLTDNKAYWDTCAIRMCLALIKSGMTIPGRMPINAGTYKGKLIEPGQKALSEILSRRHVLGKPEVFKTVDAENEIGSRHGIVSFFKIPSDSGADTNQGHIDLVRFESNFRTCSSACYFAARQVWFWPLS